MCGQHYRIRAFALWLDRLEAVVLCWIEVDLDAIAANVRALQAAAEPRAGVTAVVKANAYGMGASAVAKAAVDAGARGVAVARVSEGRRLRESGFRQPILLLSGMDPDEAAQIVELDLTPTLSTWSSAEALSTAAGGAGKTLGVQVKVDTGMTRYGAPPDEAIAIVRGLGTLHNLQLEGFYTHFAAADDPFSSYVKHRFNAGQIEMKDVESLQTYVTDGRIHLHLRDFLGLMLKNSPEVPDPMRDNSVRSARVQE